MDEIQYKLIEFTKESHNKKKSIDFIPSSWISYDSELKDLVTKFMPPPYDNENLALLHSLVKCAAPAPDAWPSYSIAIRGEARTYGEAIKKLKVLEKKEYVYSTDEEYTAKDKAVIATKAYEKKGFDHDTQLWDVPELVDKNKNLLAEETSLNSVRRESKRNSAANVEGSDKTHRRSIQKSAQGTQYSSVNFQDEENDEQFLLFDDMLQIIEPNNNISLKDIKATISKGFHSQSLHLTRISIQLEELKNMFSELKSKKTSEIFNFSCPAEKYSIELPLKLLEEFTAFDNKLLTDENFRDDMMANMWQIASVCAPILQTVRDILKKFISRDVTLQFTAVKNTGKKLVLSKTKFFSCVQDVVITKYQQDEKVGPVGPKDFEQAVGKVINNAKDWEGNRSTRKKM